MYIVVKFKGQGDKKIATLPNKMDIFRSYYLK